MCTNQHHRHSIFCILPPYMMHSVAKNGNADQRNAALQVLSNDTTFRNLRTGPRISSNLDKKLPSAFVVAGDKQRTIFTGLVRTATTSKQSAFRKTSTIKLKPPMEI